MLISGIGTRPDWYLLAGMVVPYVGTVLGKKAKKWLKVKKNHFNGFCPNLMVFVFAF